MSKIAPAFPAKAFVYEQNREVLTVNLRKPQIEALQEVKA